MRREPKARTALALAVTVAILCGAGPASAQTSPTPPSSPEKAAAEPARFAPLTDWLERAARAYQTEIAGKLSVPREAGAAGDDSSAARGAAWLSSALRAGTDAALRYVDFWIGRAFELAGIPRPAAPVTAQDRAAQDAKAFVEARRKADEDWKAAEQKQQQTAQANTTGGSARAEAEAAAKARAAAEQERKEELARKKQELDKQIEEGMRKLEEYEKANKAKKQEEQRKALDEKKRKSEEDAARKAAEEMRLAEVRAEEKRKDEDAARKAEDDRKAAEEKRLADLRAEDERKAAAQEAERKAEEQKAAKEKRLAEERAAAQRKAADEAAARKADGERKAAEEKRLVEERKAAAEASKAPPRDIARADVTGPALRAKEAAPPAHQEKSESPSPPSESAKTEPPPARLAEQPAPRAETRPEATPEPKKVRIAARAKSKIVRQSRAGGTRKCRAAKPGKRIYIVRRGDTLWDISRRHLRKGKRYVSLYRANRSQIRDPDLIYPCQRLRLPKKRV